MMDEGMREWSIEVRPDVTAFMDRLTAGDPEQAASGFHDGFLNLDPRTVGVVSREQLRMALPYRARLFESIGAVGTDRTDLRECPLDDLHTLVQGTWELRFADRDAQPLALRSTYLLRRGQDGWSAVAYLNHQDIVEVVHLRAEARSGGV